jgi:hypothetical protein
MGFNWIARYRDNSFITSADNISFDNVPRHNLWTVDILAANSKKIFTMTLRPGYNVFYRRRAVMSPGKTTEVVHILGYQVKNTEVSAVAFIYESDWRIDMSDFRSANDRLASWKEYKDEIMLRETDLVEISWD